MKISDGIIQQISDSYRKIRNTARYLLGNINDFNRSQKVSYKNMLEIDKFALHKLEKLKEKLKNIMITMNYLFFIPRNPIFLLNRDVFIYLDIIKDRLYCEYKDSVERRSAQTVLTEILDVLVRIISPVLSFTAEEIWERLDYETKEEGVHLSKWIEAKPEYIDEKLAQKWSKIQELRRS